MACGGRPRGGVADDHMLLHRVDVAALAVRADVDRRGRVGLGTDQVHVWWGSRGDDDVEEFNLAVFFTTGSVS